MACVSMADENNYDAVLSVPDAGAHSRSYLPFCKTIFDDLRGKTKIDYSQKTRSMEHTYFYEVCG